MEDFLDYTARITRVHQKEFFKYKDRHTNGTYTLNSRSEHNPSPWYALYGVYVEFNGVNWVWVRSLDGRGSAVAGVGGTKGVHRPRTTDTL